MCLILLRKQNYPKADPMFNWLINPSGIQKTKTPWLIYPQPTKNAFS